MGWVVLWLIVFDDCVAVLTDMLGQYACKEFTREAFKCVFWRTPLFNHQGFNVDRKFLMLEDGGTQATGPIFFSHELAKRYTSEQPVVIRDGCIVFAHVRHRLLTYFYCAMSSRTRL